MFGFVEFIIIGFIFTFLWILKNQVETNQIDIEEIKRQLRSKE